MKQRWGSAQGGATMVEMLLALPVVLLLGLGVAQFTLVYQAKHALDYALTQAARQGAVEHASADAIQRGFGAGLAPYLYGADDWAGLLKSEARAVDHVRGGLAAGWIVLRQRSPTRESFSDWAEPALDPMGEPIPGLVEIANDNLDSRRLRMQPASGVAGVSRAEPIGRLSGQTLADANILRLELVYGVRLGVPVVGAIVIRTLALWNGCAPADAMSARRARLGLVRLDEGAPGAATQTAQGWMCAFLEARDPTGRAAGRIPIRASATIRMMSPARHSTMTQPRLDLASARTSSGGVAPDSPGGPDAGQPALGEGTPGSPGRSTNPVPLDNGFVTIGSDRSYPQPSAHPALCDG